MGIVECDESVNEYVPVGEQEFDEQCKGRLRQAVRRTIAEGFEDIQPKVSTPLVKTLTLLALQNAIDRFAVDDWDPLNSELRQFRVLEDPEDAWSGEEYFRET
eukprot:s368_g14.t1